MYGQIIGQKAKISQKFARGIRPSLFKRWRLLTRVMLICPKEELQPTTNRLEGILGIALIERRATGRRRNQ